MNKFKTAFSASALSAGLIVLIFLFRDTTVSAFKRAFELAFYFFILGGIGANVYIWLADKLSILGRVVRGANFPATLKALIIVIPIATVLSLVGIALRAPHEAQMWIYLAIFISCHHFRCRLRLSSKGVWIDGTKPDLGTTVGPLFRERFLERGL